MNTNALTFFESFHAAFQANTIFINALQSGDSSNQNSNSLTSSCSTLISVFSNALAWNVMLFYY